MSRRCELTGKGVLTGHRVSHSNIKTNRRYLPNLNVVSLDSETLQRRFRFRIAASALRTVDHRGGLDAFLMKAKDEELSPRARQMKRDLMAAVQTPASSAIEPIRPTPCWMPIRLAPATVAPTAFSIMPTRQRPEASSSARRVASAAAARSSNRWLKATWTARR